MKDTIKIEKKFNAGWLGFIGFLSFTYFETGNPIHLMPFGAFIFFIYFIDDMIN